MTDVVASGILSSLLDRLPNQIVDEFGWLRDIGAELKKLEGTLSIIRDVLEDAEERQVQEKALRGWLRRLKDVAYDIDDLLDEDFTRNRKRNSIGNLFNLVILNLERCTSFVSLPTSIGHLKSLQTLNLAYTRIKKLPESAREANLIEMDGLHSVGLAWDLDTYKKKMEAYSTRTNVEGRSRQGLINALAVAEEVLNGLQPHENLTLLAIFCYPGKIFPKWLESSFPNLVEIYLSSCFRCETLPRISQLHNLETLSLKKLPAVKSLPLLGQLPALKVLNLASLLAVKSLGSEFYGAGDGAFPVLENLSLEHMPELEEWCEASAGRRSFPRLWELRLLDCRKLKELPSSFPSVEQLYLCANSELLLSSLPSGTFPNVVASGVLNSLLDRLRDRITSEFGQLMDVGTELKKLAGTLSAIRDVLEDAEARQVQEKALKGWLRRLKDVAYDIDDLLDEGLAKNRKRSLADPESSTASWMMGTSLQTLNLAHTRIKKLPESLCCLSNLRSINIRHCFFLHELPENKKNTKSLTCLHPGHCHKLTRMPAGLTQPSYFRELLLFDLCEKSECGLKELNRLNLEGILLITSLENVKNVQQAREANLIEMDGLHSLGLAWDLDTYKKQMEAYVRTDVEGRSRQGLISALAVAEEVLDGLQPHENLTLLAIYRYPGKTFPKWLESSLPNLLELYLSFCFRCETLPKISQLHNLEILSLEKLPAIKSLPSLGQLPALKVLHLVALLAVKSLGSEFYGAGDGAFPVLENLSLEHMPELEEWCEASAGRRSFPRLSELRLLDCRKLKELPSSFPSVERLYLCANTMADIVSSSLLRLVFNKLGAQITKEFGLVMGVEKELTKLETTLAAIRHVLADAEAWQSQERALAGSLRRLKDAAFDADDVLDEVAAEALRRTSRGTKAVLGKLSSLPSSIMFQSRIARKVKKIGERLDEIADERSKLMRLNKNEDDYNKILEVLQIIFSNMKLLRSLHLAHYPMKKLPVSVKNLRHLRYLNLSLTSLKNLPPSIGLLQNLQILNLASCRSLQALPETVGDLFNLYKLDLSGCSRLLSLPSSIGRLRSLQNLDLSISGIQKLPESVSCLSDLRSLGLRHCCFVRKLPENMKNMASLVHLDIYACYELTCMPSGIGQLSCLRTLPIFVAGGRNKCSLGELNRLNLKGRLDIRKLENVKNAEEAKEANLIGKQNLQSLHLSWDLNAYKKIIDECASNNNDEESMHKIMEAFLAQEWDTDSELAEKILEGLQPHQNLTVLEIEGFLGNTFPRWLLESTLPNLVELKLGTFVRSETLPELIQLHHLKILDLDNLLAIKRLPPLGQCPSLKVLSLSCLPEVECLGSEFYGGKGAFLALEKLTLSCMSKLEEWFGFAGQEFFPLLSDLRIESCPKLRALPSDFPSVKELSMCCDDQLLLSAFESGAFPNLDGLDIGNCTSLSKSSLPQVLIEHLRSNPGISLRMSASRLQRLIRLHRNKASEEALREEKLLATMADVVSSSLLRLVFDKLGAQVTKEFGLVMGVEKELNELETTLAAIRDVLADAEARQAQERALAGWLRRLKDAAFDADDVLDEVAAAEALRRTSRRRNGSGTKAVLGKLSSLPNSIIFQSRIARKVKKIRERLDEIADERSKFHLREGVVHDCKIENSARAETGSFVVQSEVYGREEDKETIIYE
ncbi:Disease resistance protein RGA2 [Ananas comosus]|uniref:Disease resistance protein RGA2 n=1 Tax=Ananas comosus TaxID=4615 RepID=A0A199VH76_ANACO|nr:Disease resistance protein RGA2 [Ananas comosus]